MIGLEMPRCPSTLCLVWTAAAAVSQEAEGKSKKEPSEVRVADPGLQSTRRGPRLTGRPGATLEEW